MTCLESVRRKFTPFSVLEMVRSVYVGAVVLEFVWVVSAAVFRGSVRMATSVVTRTKGGTRLTAVDGLVLRTGRGPTAVLMYNRFGEKGSAFIGTLVKQAVYPASISVYASMMSVVGCNLGRGTAHCCNSFTGVGSRIVSLSSLRHCAMNSTGRVSGAVCMRVRLPLRELGRNIIIVSAPNINKLSPHRTALAGCFLPRTSVAVFVASIGRPLAAARLSFCGGGIRPCSGRDLIMVGGSSLGSITSMRRVQRSAVRGVTIYARASASGVLTMSISTTTRICPRDSVKRDRFSRLETAVTALISGCQGNVLLNVQSGCMRLLSLIVAPLRTRLTRVRSPSISRLGYFISRETRVRRGLGSLEGPDSAFHARVGGTVGRSGCAVISVLGRTDMALRDRMFGRLMGSPRTHSSRNNG